MLTPYLRKRRKKKKEKEKEEEEKKREKEEVEELFLMSSLSPYPSNSSGIFLVTTDS